MKEFVNFLKQQGAAFNKRGITYFQHAQTTKDVSLLFLNHLQCLWVNGPDAKKFLQGQVTCDINQLLDCDVESESDFDPSNTGRWLRGSHCNTKGRMVFDFIGFSRSKLSLNTDSTPAVGLITEADLIEPAQAAMKKYMVFSKAKTHIEQEQVLIEVSGKDCKRYLEDLIGSGPPEVGQAKLYNIENSQPLCEITVITLSSDRFLCILPSRWIMNNWQSLAQDKYLGGQFDWDLAEINAGTGHVRAETIEEFIPQDLNHQLLNAINFKKGCYIGQEVVARLQYRGKLKKHMRRAILASETETDLGSLTLPAPGSNLYLPDKPQSVGKIISAAPAQSDSIEMLVLITDEAFESEKVFIGEETNQKLKFIPLPYAITN